MGARRSTKRRPERSHSCYGKPSYKPLADPCRIASPRPGWAKIKGGTGPGFVFGLGAGASFTTSSEEVKIGAISCLGLNLVFCTLPSCSLWLWYNCVEVPPKNPKGRRLRC